MRGDENGRKQAIFDSLCLSCGDEQADGKGASHRRRQQPMPLHGLCKTAIMQYFGGT
ncbi:MAG: hypothetical protein N838_18635 [Thiohalocapsa sp. PB-PSB1]|nr:MAG: hypothetical protein N838_18635 [Thiohalocapsa sp. PB-PSB1]